MRGLQCFASKVHSQKLHEPAKKEEVLSPPAVTRGRSPASRKRLRRLQPHRCWDISSSKGQPASLGSIAPSERPFILHASSGRLRLKGKNEISVNSFDIQSLAAVAVFLSDSSSAQTHKRFGFGFFVFFRFDKNAN